MFRKKKKCKQCHEESFLFSHGYCLKCWKQNNPYNIPKISKKHLERLKKYNILREKYLKATSKCEFPNCTEQATEIHHAEGRVGNALFSEFRALCSEHHKFVELNPILAKELNLSKTRLK